ncbi:hypothetical protein H072_10835 [Dactylellina haptotyla CBS 200.50]|uniref:UDP-N-acetylglucosamine transferase subunit ALG14 n=1 Tax=Dactylellina haptotyla (strain CBS 200.50) TaxID=1284197 RepID=S7ZY66_DACHA|nr:hypothetical protein H072_10835 [Dactylellina haptotyla CBS 200.50]
MIKIILAALLTLLVLTIFVSLRIFSILPNRQHVIPQTQILQSSRIVEITTPSKSHILFILGSGGHTTEMFAMLQDISPDTVTHRTYVFSSGDNHSAQKAQAFEESLVGKFTKRNNMKIGYRLLELPRARRVKQSWLTTPLSCLICLWSCMDVLRGADIVRMTKEMKSLWADMEFPDLVICNGPGTAVMVVLACYFYKFFGKCATRVIYVESFARVTTLSLSGRLLLPLANRFFVQWPQLADKYPGTEHLGFLVS